jgi:putative transposase
MLSDKIEYYKTYKKTLYVLPSKYKKEYPFLKEIDSLALVNTQLHLENAYRKFFQKLNNKPKFKSKKSYKQSYTTNNVNNSIKVLNNKIKLSKIGYVKVKFHRELPKESIIKSCTITKTKTEKYYISILVEYEEILNQDINLNKINGLDFSMTDFYVDIYDNRGNYPKYYRKMENKLARENRKLSKMKLRSKNWYKQKIKIAIIYEKIANQRKDFLHKLSRQITNAYDIICVEDLNMQNMSQSLNFGKSVMDCGWGMFKNFLDYKAKKLIKIDKWFPSTKLCHVCNYKNDNLKLSDRIWECPNCHTIHDRDLNAAINIKNEGLRTVGTTGIACECWQNTRLEQEAIAFRRW